MPFTDTDIASMRRDHRHTQTDFALQCKECALLDRLETAEAYAKAARSGREAYFPQLYAAWLTASGRGQA